MAGWNRKRVVWGCYGLLVGALVLASAVGLFDTAPASAPGPTPTEQRGSASMPLLIDDPTAVDEDIQGYYYCWDTGLPRPHRMGHRVSHDHLCTWGELRYAGVVFMHD